MLNLKTKIYYGIGGICDNSLYTFTGTYLLLFLTTVAKVNPTVAGLIIAIGSIWEAVMAPIVGNLSDKMKSKFGRRKPFLLIASIPVIVFTTLLFTTVPFGDTFKAIFYGLMIVLFWTFFSTEFIPYLSWGADLTTDYNERTVLRSYSYIFNQIGMLIGMVLPSLIVDYFLSIGKSEEFSWMIVALFVSFFAGLSLVICSLGIKKDDNPNFKKEEAKKEKKEKVNILSLIKDYIKILKLKPILVLIGSSMLYLISNTIFSSARVFFMQYNMGLSGTLVTLMMFVITISGIIFVPFIANISKRLDKKISFMYGIGFSGIILILLRFIGVTNLTGVIIVCLFYSLANTCYWQLMPAMMYDVCSVEELHSGESHSGSVISLQALSESISIALGSQTLGILLDVSGFDESALVQGAKALTSLNNLFTLIPGIFMILVFVVMTLYKMNKERLDKINLAINDRKQGKEINISEFKDLF